MLHYPAGRVLWLLAHYESEHGSPEAALAYARACDGLLAAQSQAEAGQTRPADEDTEQGARSPAQGGLAVQGVPEREDIDHGRQLSHDGEHTLDRRSSAEGEGAEKSRQGVLEGEGAAQDPRAPHVSENDELNPQLPSERGCDGQESTKTCQTPVKGMQVPTDTSPAQPEGGEQIEAEGGDVEQERAGPAVAVPPEHAGICITLLHCMVRNCRPRNACTRRREKEQKFTTTKA